MGKNLQSISRIVASISMITYLILAIMVATNTILAWRIVTGTLAAIAWSIEFISPFGNSKERTTSFLMILIWILNVVLAALRIL